MFCSCYNSPGYEDLNVGRGNRADEEQEWKQKRRSVSTSPKLVPHTVSYSCVCPPGKQTSLPCLQEQARTASRTAKVAVTLHGFPTQLSEKSLPSAALSAPLCIKAALCVTKLLKLWIAVLCQECCAETGSARAISLARRGLLVSPHASPGCSDSLAASPQPALWGGHNNPIAWPFFSVASMVNNSWHQVWKQFLCSLGHCWCSQGWQGLAFFKSLLKIIPFHG